MKAREMKNAKKIISKKMQRKKEEREREGLRLLCAYAVRMQRETVRERWADGLSSPSDRYLFVMRAQKPPSE